MGLPQSPQAQYRSQDAQRSNDHPYPYTPNLCAQWNTEGSQPLAQREHLTVHRQIGAALLFGDHVGKQSLAGRNIEQFSETQVKACPHVGAAFCIWWRGGGRFSGPPLGGAALGGRRGWWAARPLGMH